MTGSSTSTVRLLVLTGPNTRQSGLIEMLRSGGPGAVGAGGEREVVVAESMEEALAALRGGQIDGVFSDSTDFLPLERALATQQSGLILDTIGEGICITDDQGVMVWSNKRMKHWSPAVREQIQGKSREAWVLFTEQMTPVGAGGAGMGEQPTEHAQSTEHGTQGVGDAVRGGGGGVGRSRKFAFSIDELQYFEVFCSPVLDPQGRLTQIVSICWDATSGRRLQQKIDAIDQAGRELVKLEGEAIAKLNVGQRLKLLEEKVIKYCRQLMHFDHFAIRLLDKRSNKLEIVISVGLPSEAIEVELFAQPEGNGISGYVAATGRSYICPDVTKDVRYVQGLAAARSSLTVPLMLHNEVIGIFNIESQYTAGFTEDDRQFAEIFGRYVAMALNILNLLIVERHQAAGRLVSDVSAEMAGPLNDIVSETTLLMEDYIGNDEMKRRLQTIVDNVNTIRKSIREVAEGGAGKSMLVGKAPKTTDPLLEGKRVLVADDEPNIRQTIADLLARLGCAVDVAKDGAEACAFLAAHARYDLVLSDIKMPHKNGYEIFAAAQKIGHNPPVILMTGFGYDPAHSIVRASQEGLAAVLFKPFKVEQLLGEVKKAVAGGGKLKE